MSISNRHPNRDVTAQATRVKDHSRSSYNNINIPFYDHEEYLAPTTGLQLADRVRFEIVPAGVEETPTGVDDAVCLEAYGCTETMDVSDPMEPYSPFNEETLKEVARVANPDLESDTELTMTVRNPAEKETDGWVQEVAIECGVEISDRFVTFETVLESKDNDNDYDYEVKTKYQTWDSTDYETLGWIRLRSSEPDIPKDASGWEVRLSSAVHPEKEFDPDRVPGNQGETYKIGKLKDSSYDRHVKIPSRFHDKRSHIYCTREEEFKSRPDCDEDCTGEHLENPFIELLETNWDQVVIEYNDRDGSNDRWLFRVYFQHRKSCPEEIETAGRDNRTYTGLGLPTSLAVLEGSKIAPSSMDFEVIEKEEAKWQFTRVAYENAVDRLLSDLETTNSSITREEWAKGLMILTKPDHLDMEDSTEAMVGVNAISRVLNLIDKSESPKTCALLTGTLENILDRDFSSGVPVEHNATLSENFAAHGGPDQLLRLIENSDYSVIRKQAAKALFQARHGKGHPGPPGAALAKVDDAGNRLFALYRESPDDYFGYIIAKIIRVYAKNKDCLEIFIEADIHEQLLKMAENAADKTNCRTNTIIALRNFPLREPEAMDDIDAPNRLTELLANSTDEMMRQHLVETLACFAGTNKGRELIVDTDAPEAFLQVVSEEEVNQKWAARALDDIISSGYQETVLEANGPGLLITGLERTKEDEEEAREHLVDALSELAKTSDQARQAIIEANGMEKLLNIIDCSQKPLTIKRIAKNSETGRKIIIRNNGIERLLAPIESGENDNIPQSVYYSLKYLTNDENSRELFINANGVEKVLKTIQTADDIKIKQELIQILYKHNNYNNWISAIIRAGGPDKILTVLETAIESNAFTDDENDWRTYKLAYLLKKITDTEAGIQATRSVDGPRRIKRIIRILEAQKEQTGDEERTQRTLERVQQSFSESRRPTPSISSGYIFAGVIVRELLSSNSESTTNTNTTVYNNSTSESTPNKNATEYNNTVIRGIAWVFRALGRVYGRILVTIRHLR